MKVIQVLCHYHPPMKLHEGKVFTGVCLLGGYLSTPYLPRTYLYLPTLPKMVQIDDNGICANVLVPCTVDNVV